jgi:fluoroacetyl-CoA thioesterase
MKSGLSAGDICQHRKLVESVDVASFQGKVVHPVCSTFTLAREMEWTTRQFVLALIEDHEEGVGTYVEIVHKSPAFVGEEILFTGKIEQINGHELICSIEASVGPRIIAVGKTGQKIMKKETISRLFNHPLKARGGQNFYE